MGAEKDTKERKITLLERQKIINDRYNRQKLLGGWWDQDKLLKGHVFVVGAGALGNEIVKNLVMFGVGEISIVDYDWIEETNLNRCVFFSEDDVLGGKQTLKVEAVKRGAEKINSSVKINAINENVHDRIVNDPSFLKQFDVVALALDNWLARISIGNAAYDLGIPIVNGGMAGFDGGVFVAIPPETPCVECLLPSSNKDKILNIVFSCTEKGKIVYEGAQYVKIATMATTNSIIGALQSQEIILLLMGFKDYKTTGKWPEGVPKPLWGQQVEFYGKSHKMAVFERSISPACEYHKSLAWLSEHE